LLEEVFEPCDRPWRGLGLMGGGGLALRGPYRALDAVLRFGLVEADRGAGDATRSAIGKPTTAANRLHPVGLGCVPCGIPARDAGPITPLVRSAAPMDGIPAAAEVCIAGAILRGQATPDHCPAFGMTCTPERPLGAPMVSSEGACAAYFLYRRRAVQEASQAG
jgi:hydrogenase expression/formation protein HypD